MTQSPAFSFQHSGYSVKQAWQELRNRAPTIRQHDAAAVLGLSEAQLVASGCGENVVRLSRHWNALIEALPTLGYVAVITRNDHAVHEKLGRYTQIRLAGHLARVSDGAIDLRLFLNQRQSTA